MARQAATTSDQAPAALGPIRSQAIVAGGFVFCSGYGRNRPRRPGEACGTEIEKPRRSRH